MSGFSPLVGQVPGTGTNDNANAGNVGELLSSVTLIGSEVTLTDSTPANIGSSITLTAGDWDVWVNAHFDLGSTTNVTQLRASLSATSAAHDTTPGRFSFTQHTSTGQVLGAAASHSLPPAGPARITVAAGVSTAYYFVAEGRFSVSTCKVYGGIFARRCR